MKPNTYRETNISKLSYEKSKEIFDVLIIGGGINGAVSAACLTAQGAKVALIDKGDFANQTSQESSNLVWGGIKYLQSFEFGLVRKLCKSRNILLKNYPSRIKETRFITMIEKDFKFHPFLIYLGTLFYWLLGSFYTKAPRYLTRDKLKEKEVILQTEISNGGFEYSDAVLKESDSSFVFHFIRSAIRRGGIILNYVKANNSKYNNKFWDTEVLDETEENAKSFIIRSKIVINSCGLYVDKYNSNSNIETKHCHTFSKGVHLIVPELTQDKKVLTFFSDDERPFFAIPLNNKTCIGTTDTPVELKNLPVTVNNDDINFILNNINKRLDLKFPLTSKDIISQRCGARPLATNKVGTHKNKNSNWLYLSRKHIIEVDKNKSYISIFGGKLTDCLNIAEEISKIVLENNINLPFLKNKWFGEDLGSAKSEYELQANLLVKLNILPSAGWVELLWQRYDIDAFEILNLIRIDNENKNIIINELKNNSNQTSNLEKSFKLSVNEYEKTFLNNQYLLAEIKFMSQNELIVNLSDFLRRRTNLALIYSKNDLLNLPNLDKVCELLFNEKSKIKYNEYFNN